MLNAVLYNKPSHINTDFHIDAMISNYINIKLMSTNHRVAISIFYFYIITVRPRRLGLCVESMLNEASAKCGVNTNKRFKPE